MAFASDSTTAPALQPHLLRPFPGRQALTSALVAPESTASQPCGFSDLALREALASTAAKSLLPAAAPLPRFGDRKSVTVTDLVPDQNQIRFEFDLPGSGDLKTARALHFRREMHQALDYGFSLLDALDLPPLALDIIDDAIATLDALEARDEDREDDDPAEGTSLETAGRGFTRYGGDDEEDSDPAERDDHHGSEDDPHPWRYDPASVELAARMSHV